MFQKARVLAAAGCLLFAQGVLAELPFKAGDKELTFAGSLRQTSLQVELDTAPPLQVADEDATTFILTGTFGYFLDERQEIGLITGVAWSDAGDDTSVDALAGVSYDYHFPTEGNPMVPVVGVLARTVMFDAVSDYLYGVNAGVRLLAGPNISVNIRVYYERAREEEAFGGNDLIAEQDDLGIRVGFSWLLPGAQTQ